jgi:hypothetical protein
MPQTATTTDTRTTGERTPMTDRPENLSFLIPTSVMDSMDSTSYLTNTRSLPFCKAAPTQPHGRC